MASVLSGGEAKAFTTTSGGYVCVDSEQAPATGVFPPLFQWDDISLSGNIWAPGNESSTAFGMAWNFTYFGVPNSIMTLGSNGTLTMQFPGTITGLNSAIPSAAFPNDTMYGFWDDLNPISGVRTQEIGQFGARRWVFEWTNVAHASGAAIANVTFSITIYEGTNAILFQYLTMTGSTGGGESATIGIENNVGSAGIQYNFNNSSPTNNIYNGLAIGFYPTGITPTWMTALPPAPPTPGGGGGPVAPVVDDPDGDGEDDDRKHGRCMAGAGAGAAGAFCLVPIALMLAISLARRAA